MLEEVITIRVTTEEKQELKKVALREGRTMSEIGRIAIKIMLEEELQERR